MKFKLFITSIVFAFIFHACDSISGNHYENPELEISNPIHGSIIYGTSTITVDLLNPNESNVSEIIVTVNDTQIGSDKKYPFEFEFTSADFPNGEAIIKATAIHENKEYEKSATVIINNPLEELSGDWEYRISTTRFYEENMLVDAESVDMTILETVYSFHEPDDLEIHVGFLDTTVYTQYEVIDYRLRILSDPESEPQLIEWKSANHINLVTSNGEYLDNGILKREEQVTELYRY